MVFLTVLFIFVHFQVHAGQQFLSFCVESFLGFHKVMDDKYILPLQPHIFQVQSIHFTSAASATQGNRLFSKTTVC